MVTAIGTDVSGALIVPGHLPIWLNGAIGWKSNEPIELTLRLEPDRAQDVDSYEAVTYRFSRELLSEAIAKPEHFVGDGDIQLSWEPDEFDIDDKLAWDAEPALRVRVKDLNEDWSLFVLDGRSLLKFMTQTYMVCPEADETADVDAALAQLLGEDA